MSPASLSPSKTQSEAESKAPAAEADAVADDKAPAAEDAVEDDAAAAEDTDDPQQCAQRLYSLVCQRVSSQLPMVGLVVVSCMVMLPLVALVLVSFDYTCLALRLYVVSTWVMLAGLFPMIYLLDLLCSSFILS
jgi:hypothetical protein